jgi:hypothetical protein
MLLIEAAAEWEQYSLGVDSQIARKEGFTVGSVTIMRRDNLTAWCYFQRRLSDTSRAPKLSWEEHSALLALARAARSAQDQPPCPSFSGRLLWFIHRISGISVWVIAVYLTAVFLIHHF